MTEWKKNNDFSFCFYRSQLGYLKKKWVQLDM